MNVFKINDDDDDDECFDFVQFVISEPTKMRQKLRVFFTDFWNVFDMLTIALFFVGLTLRLQNGLVGDGQAFYCLTVALCIIRILDFFVISQHLGPFVHIIGKMVCLFSINFVLYFKDRSPKGTSEIQKQKSTKSLEQF